MKRLIVSLLALTSLPLVSVAQDDDMYFMPSKEEIQKKKKEQKTQISAYYGGIPKSVDEYNRHNTGDSLYSDIIEFRVGDAKDSTEVTYYNYGDSTVLARDVDYQWSQLISRFDDYYYGWYNPWFCRHYYWGRPWYYGGYAYGPWYDPWYDPWFYGYYDPMYFHYMSFWGWPYDPWYGPGWYGPGWYGPGWYGPGWYRPWYGPGYIGGFITYKEPESVHTWSHTSPSAPNVTYSAAYDKRIMNIVESPVGQSIMNTVTYRNGDATTAMTGRTPITTRAADMYRNSNYSSQNNNNNSFVDRSTPTYNNNYNNSSSSHVSSGGGGGSFGGSHSGFSGTSTRSGGGSFGGGRR